MRGIIAGFLQGLALFLKTIFGMNKAKETEINDVGEVNPPKRDKRSFSERLRVLGRTKDERNDHDGT